MPQIKTAPFDLMTLPYEENAFEPYISTKTLGFHYGRHHQGYLTKLNELIAETEFEGLRLEEIIVKTSRDPRKKAVFNNAAQVWNHNFYWNSLSPGGGEKPGGVLGQEIETRFGSYENLIKELVQAGLSQFGSGWVWLIKAERSLKVIHTADAENPLSLAQGKPLLTFDVWEHAYYLDYQNRRSDYLTTTLNKFINWEFAAKNYAAR